MKGIFSLPEPAEAAARGNQITKLLSLRLRNIVIRIILKVKTFNCGPLAQGKE